MYQNTLICTGTIIIKRILSVTKAWYNCCCFWVIISLSIALFFENQKVKTVNSNTTNETSWVCFSFFGVQVYQYLLYHVVLTSRIYTPSDTYAPARAPAAPSTFSNVEIAAVLPSFLIYQLHLKPTNHLNYNGILLYIAFIQSSERDIIPILLFVVEVMVVIFVPLTKISLFSLIIICST